MFTTGQNEEGETKKPVKSLRDILRESLEQAASSQSTPSEPIQTSSKFEAQLARLAEQGIERVDVDNIPSQTDPMIKEIFDELRIKFALLQSIPEKALAVEKAIDSVVNFGVKLNFVQINDLLRAARSVHSINAIRALFRHLKANNVKPENVAFSLAINTLCENGHPKEGIELFEQGSAEGTEMWTDAYTALIRCHEKLGDLEAVKRTFNAMFSNGVPRTTGVYTAAISAAARRGDVDLAYHLLDIMELDDTTLYRSMDADLLAGPSANEAVRGLGATDIEVGDVPVTPKVDLFWNVRPPMANGWNRFIPAPAPNFYRAAPVEDVHMREEVDMMFTRIDKEYVTKVVIEDTQQAIKSVKRAQSISAKPSAANRKNPELGQSRNPREVERLLEYMEDEERDVNRELEAEVNTREEDAAQEKRAEIRSRIIRKNFAKVFAGPYVAAISVAAVAGNVEVARIGFDRAMAMVGPTADVFEAAAVAEGMAGHWDKALDHLTHCLKLDITPSPALFRAVMDANFGIIKQ